MRAVLPTSKRRRTSGQVELPKSDNGKEPYDQVIREV